ncbi:MAG: fumarate hydratase [Treponematales bacterium]
MNLIPAIRAAFGAAAFRKVETDEKPAFRGEQLFVPPQVLTQAAEVCFRELAFYFRESYLALLAAKLNDPDASANDRFVIRALLKNAVIAAGGELPSCQDTGTAAVFAWKDEAVFSAADERRALERGIEAAYRDNYLRSSQTAALSFFEEGGTGMNLPAAIHIEAVQGGGAGREGPAYRFLFSAKGGGSSNKTAFFSMPPALLEEKAFDAFLQEKITALGTAACPPYQLAVIVGGASPEENMEVLKLATSGLLEHVPFFENPLRGERAETGPRRDKFWEERAMEIGRDSGLGAQFGGGALLLSARVLRLPRHAASCPVSIGVSCAAHRNMLAVVNSGGLLIERLAHEPALLLREEGIALDDNAAAAAPEINLDRPLREICRSLKALSAAREPGAMALLSGKLLVARDRAHLRWHELIAQGKPLPSYLFEHPVYYAGPSETPPGRVIGSLGPTTAQRMDGYGEELMSRGASLVTLAKGNRSEAFRECCKKHGGFYLGTIGGAAALLSSEHISAARVIDYPDLGMEAVRLITVRKLPAFVI